MPERKDGFGPLQEGTLKKGGTNSDYQVLQRPPPPPPMNPPPAAPQPSQTTGGSGAGKK